MTPKYYIQQDLPSVCLGDKSYGGFGEGHELCDQSVPALMAGIQ